MKFIKFILILAVCFIYCGGAERTNEMPEANKLEANTFIIGVENFDYLPLYAFKNGKYQGFSRELLDGFAKSRGYKFIYRPLPVKRLFNDLINKTIDFKYPDHPVWQKGLKKGTKLIYSQVNPYTDGVLVLPKRKGKGKKHLKNLGTVLGFTPFEYLGDIKAKRVILKENPSFIGLLRQTLTKRIDGAYVNIDVGLYHLENSLNKPASLRFDSNLPHTKDYYYLSTVKHPKVIGQLDKYLKKNTKKIKKLREKYNLAG